MVDALVRIIGRGMRSTFICIQVERRRMKMVMIQPKFICSIAHEFKWGQKQNFPTTLYSTNKTIDKAELRKGSL